MTFKELIESEKWGEDSDGWDIGRDHNNSLKRIALYVEELEIKLQNQITYSEFLLKEIQKLRK